MEFVKVPIHYYQLANNLLDFLIEAYDVEPTIELLLNLDYSPDEVYSMDFAADDIENVLNEMKERESGPLV